MNRFSAHGAQVLNLPLPNDHGLPVRGTLKDADSVLRMARCDPTQSVAMALEGFVPSCGKEQDWPDMLAANLADDQDLCLHSWAERQGIRPESVSRGFRLAYGTTPRGYRAEWRAQKAWQRSVKANEPLAQIAADCGFADQSHMHRAVLSLTGRSPGAWRKQVKSVQDTPNSGR